MFQKLVQENMIWKKKKENYAESCMDTNHTSQFRMMPFWKTSLKLIEM